VCDLAAVDNSVRRLEPAEAGTLRTSAIVSLSSRDRAMNDRSLEKEWSRSHCLDSAEVQDPARDCVSAILICHRGALATRTDSCRRKNSVFISACSVDGSTGPRDALVVGDSNGEEQQITR